MFFSQSITSPQRKKQPHQLYQRIISKPQKGLEQFKQYVQLRIYHREYSDIERIISYVTFRNTHQTNMPTRILIISCFQIILMQIKDIPSKQQLKKSINQVISIVLKYFSDPFEKVRYHAVSSIYNIISFYSVSYLSMFTKTFQALFVIVTDQILDIKTVVFHLNHCLKKLLHHFISLQESFDVNQFMSILIENFITESSNIKQFLIDWLIAIDQIPQFQISFYLPLVFKELFKLLEGQSSSLRDKSQECIKNFLSGFKELLRNRLRIEKKIREDSFSMLLGVLLEVIKQTFNPVVKYHGLQWLQVFTQLFYNQLIKKQHVEVRRSFRSQFLLKEMKQPQNAQRTSKILSLIRQQIVQADQQNGSQSFNILNGIDFLPTPRQKQRSNSVIEEKIFQQLQQQEQFMRSQSMLLGKSINAQSKVTEFLVEIFLSYYSNIIVLVMYSSSEQDQKIRKITSSINNILLDSFPIVQDKAKKSRTDMVENKSIINTQSQSYLEKLQIPLIIKLGKFLKQSRTPHKIQAIIKWIKILYEKGTNPQLNLQISSLIQKIVQKICQKSILLPTGSNTNNSSIINNKNLALSSSLFYHVNQINKQLFTLLADSIFMRKYLDLFIQTLLSYFYQNQTVDSQKILIQVISMKIDCHSNSSQKQSIYTKSEFEHQDSTSVIYITILKRLMLFEAEKGKFKQKMIQNLISILITEDSLSVLRKKLRSTSIRQIHLTKGINQTTSKNNKQNLNLQEQNNILNLIKQLFEYFCLNEGFSIIFCFLTGMYSLTNKILNYIAEQNILDRPRIKAFIKASNLLECYNLNHFKIDILKSQAALKGFLGYLMVIPPSKLNKVLLNRIPEDFQFQREDDQQQNMKQIKQQNRYINFQQQLFQRYLTLIQKHHQQTLIIEKMQQKRKQRQRQASMTIQLNKQLTKQLKPQSKSILKPTKRILKQQTHNNLLKGSLSSKFIKSSQSNYMHGFNSVQIQKTLQFSKSQKSLQQLRSQDTLTLEPNQSSQHNLQSQRSLKMDSGNNFDMYVNGDIVEVNLREKEKEGQQKLVEKPDNQKQKNIIDENVQRKKKKQSKIKVINMQID